jgi:hypothetical protein
MKLAVILSYSPAPKPFIKIYCILQLVAAFLSHHTYSLLGEERRYVIGDWGLGTGDWGLGTGDWGLGTGDWGLGTGDWGLGTGDWGLGTGDWGLGTGDWGNISKFGRVKAPNIINWSENPIPIPNPQSPVPFTNLLFITPELIRGF